MAVHSLIDPRRESGTFLTVSQREHHHPKRGNESARTDLSRKGNLSAVGFLGIPPAGAADVRWVLREAHGFQSHPQSYLPEAASARLQALRAKHDPEQMFVSYLTANG